MIYLKEGAEDMLPYVEVEITTGRWPFEYWYEVSYFDPNNEVEGVKIPGWTHDWQKDGGCFGFWRVLRKAHEAMLICWEEQFDEMEKKENEKLA